MTEQNQTSLQKGLRALESKQFEDATRHFQKAIFENPDCPKAWYFLGVIQEEMKDPQGAAYMYYLALDTTNSFLPARDALTRLGYLNQTSLSR